MKKVVPYLTYLGTRPPTVDEWEQYELHHRRRMSIKEDVAAVKESFSKMLENGTYKGDLFSDL